MAQEKRKRADMKPHVKRTVIVEALKQPRIPRRALAVRLQRDIDAMGELVPETETLERLISHARNHEPSPEDAPFSLGILGSGRFQLAVQEERRQCHFISDTGEKG